LAPVSRLLFHETTTPGIFGKTVDFPRFPVYSNDMSVLFKGIMAAGSRKREKKPVERATYAQGTW
jgi:hypothetical protein